MAVVSVTTIASETETVTKDKLNGLAANLVTEFNGSIDNSNLKAGAGIVDTKLATISTAGKVSGAALTLLTSIPAGAGLIPGANVFPAGMITLWSGAISAIPSGWVICDGTNSTPNLTDRFVIHASADTGATYDVGDTGGSMTHSHADTLAAPAHTHTGPSHTHAQNVGIEQSNTATGSPYNVTILSSDGTGQIITAGDSGNSTWLVNGGVQAGGTGATGAASATALAGSVTDGSTVPAYYALAYIMKT